MNKKDKKLPLIIKAPVYIAGLLVGYFGSQYILDKLKEDNSNKEKARIVKEASEVRAHASEVKSALEVHYMHYNEYPEKLDELVPSGFKMTPLTLSGDPYCYKRKPDKKGFTLKADEC